MLTELKVTLQPLDRVSVRHADTGRVQVVVNRVRRAGRHLDRRGRRSRRRQQDEPTRYVGQKRVLTAGVPGVRTVVDHVTTVDGVETARVPLSDTVTQAPVDEVVGVGSKARPVVAKAPAAAPPPRRAPGRRPAGPPTPSTGRPSPRASPVATPPRSPAAGKYYGLYQFSVGTWAAVGGSGLPSQASADEQTARAKMLYNRSGAGQWPVCGKNLFS